MNREDIARDIATRFNNGEGTVTDLSKDYINYDRNKHNRDIVKYGIVKDKNTDKFIIPDKPMQGQIDILGTTRELESLEGDKVTNTMANIDKEQIEGKGEVLEVVKVDNDVKEIKEPTKIEGLEVKVNNEPIPRKKKTFEIEIDLEQLLRVQAAILDITINDYVNEVLRNSISENVKSIIG